MKNHWFFVIGSFAFLCWYVPLAVSDDMVTIVEIAMIGINVLCFISNLWSILLPRVENSPISEDLESKESEAK